MAEIFWKGKCFACTAPLDIILMCEDGKVFDFVDDQVDMSLFDNNDSIYKFFGCRARKICMACFNNHKKMKNHKHIKNIEFGKFPKMDESMSQEEVKRWFDVLKRSWESYNR